jgi:hypothetical protein
VGKLFERINADIHSINQKLSAQEISARHFSQRVFAHATETRTLRGISAAQGGFLLLLFFGRQRKVRETVSCQLQREMSRIKI